MKTFIAAGLALVSICFADSEKKIAESDLPAPVRQALKDQSKGATIKGFTKEVEHGRTSYEAEMIVDGHSKDVSFDPSGKVVSIEEETPLEKTPAAVRSAIEKAASGGTLRKVERVTENGKITYEATIRKGTKNSEVQFDASGNRLR
jgi:uncharacterized membrane protein YkoI